MNERFKLSVLMNLAKKKTKKLVGIVSNNLIMNSII